MLLVVYAVNKHDCKGVYKVIEKLNQQFYTLVKIFTDGGYQGKLIEKVKRKFDLNVISRTDTEDTFKVLPKIWIVERTFVWFESYRKLSKCFEYQTDTDGKIV